MSRSTARFPKAARPRRSSRISSAAGRSATAIRRRSSRFPAHRVTFADRAGNGHVRLSLASGAGGSLKAIAFRAAETPLGRALLAARGKPLHVAGTLCLDHYGGAARPQLRIIDAAEPDGRF